MSGTHLLSSTREITYLMSNSRHFSLKALILFRKISVDLILSIFKLIDISDCTKQQRPFFIFDCEEQSLLKSRPSVLFSICIYLLVSRLLICGYFFVISEEKETFRCYFCKNCQTTRRRKAQTKPSESLHHQ